ncbi:uncharacterized protein LOC108110440 [Drosophila eugracilis]|uniref:uncharacterized protein LOC108110440 n=1 Tax=Drosophila eugracilis TaxID=29029 RepID=UPI0007E6C326|nr:uncharacterized protein LOC108110440 [Drosophila eugracilis]
MDATRVLLIFQLLACSMSLMSCCQRRSCQPFTGWNNCVDKGLTEPKLPPRDNICCGPHCVYTPPEPPKPCNCTVIQRCLLDTHCGGGMPFKIVRMSGCALEKENASRLKDGYAILISFPFDQKKCLSMNTMCGINCCCRENCPKLFCKF